MGIEKEVNEHAEALKKLNSEPDSETDLIESLLYHVGEMGLYQKLLFLLMLPFTFFYVCVYFVQMFITVTPQNYWCAVPELAGLSQELRRNLSAPGALTGAWDHCMTYDTNWTNVLNSLTPPPDGTPLVPCRYGWEFEFKDIPYETVVTERGWVCDSASYVPTAQSMFFVGSLVGGVLFGWLADKFGRVPALIGANVIGGIGGVATIFTSGVWDFIFCRFLVGMAMDNCFMILYILVLEYVGPSYRTIVANGSLAIFFGGSAVSLPWIAYYLANWRLLLWITAGPMLLAVFAPLVLPESVRWLIYRGRIHQAATILRRFESVNGTKIPEDLMENFIVTANKTKQEEQESFIAIFRSAPLRRTVLFMVVVYMGCAIVFDGLVRLSDSFNLDFFVTFTFASATEVPAILLLAVGLDKWGRRNLTSYPLCLAGIFILIAIFVPKGVVQATLAITARFFMNMCFTAAIQWSTEFIPTPFRASGSSALHISGFAATILTPFVVYSERIWSVLPLIILGIIAVIGGCITLTLPETKGQAMPQTVADSEKIIREQSLCGKAEDSGDGPYRKKIRMNSF